MTLDEEFLYEKVERANYLEGMSPKTSWGSVIATFYNTVDFFDTQEFSTMLKKPFIINTSRPQLINKKALINSLNNNTISGLAMDFISYNADNKWDADLRKYSGSKLLLTPHIAGNTYESVSEASEVVVDKFHSLV